MFCCDVISIDALYDYTLYVRGAYNGPYIRIKHHIYVRAYNHRITNGQRIILSYDETEFTAHLLFHPLLATDPRTFDNSK